MTRPKRCALARIISPGAKAMDVSRLIRTRTRALGESVHWQAAEHGLCGDRMALMRTASPARAAHPSTRRVRGLAAASDQSPPPNFWK